MFGQRWTVFLAISSLAVVFNFLVALLVLFLPVKAYDTSYDYYDYDEDVSTTPDDAFSICMLVLSNLIFYVIVAVSDGALIRATAEVYVGVEPTMLGSIGWGLTYIWPLVGSLVLVIAVVCLPVIALLLLAVYLSPTSATVYASDFSYFFLAFLVFLGVLLFVVVVTYHIYPIIVVEGKGVLDSIRGSWELSKDHRGFIAGCLFRFEFVRSLIDRGLSMITQAGGSKIIEITLALMFSILFSALGSILQAVVYFHVRANKEGLNRESLAQELQILTETAYTTMEAPVLVAGKDTLDVKSMHSGEVV